MSFTGLDDMQTKISQGQRARIPFHRIIQTGATSVAARWHECYTAGGTGGTGVLTGTAGQGVAKDNTSAGAWVGAAMYHGVSFEVE